MKKVSGVYAIRSKINGKMYVGSSVGIEDRWKLHRKRLLSNTHHSIALQRAYNKYGAENFEYVILYECLPIKSDLIFYEQWFLNLYGDYNASRIAGSPLGYKHKRETVEKILVSKGCKPVIQVDLQGRIIKKYDFAIDAEKETGIKAKNISRSVKNYWYTGDCFWVENENDISFFMQKHNELIDNKRKKIVSCAVEKLSKCVIKFSLSGNIVDEYNSMSDAARDNNVNVSSISFSISKGILCDGYLYTDDSDKIIECVEKYKNRKELRTRNQQKKIAQIDLSTNAVIKVWDSLSEVNRMLNIGIPNISAVLNGRRNRAGGFGWKFYAKE